MLTAGGNYTRSITRDQTSGTALIVLVNVAISQTFNISMDNSSNNCGQWKLAAKSAAAQRCSSILTGVTFNLLIKVVLQSGTLSIEVNPHHVTTQNLSQM